VNKNRNAEEVKAGCSADCRNRGQIQMKATCLFLLLTATLTACKRQHDSTLALAAGTWTCDVDDPNGDHFHSRLSFDPQGRYSEICSNTTAYGTQLSTIQGTMKIEDGFIVDTITNHSNTNAVLPNTTRAKIIRQNEREITVNYVEADFERTFRKVK
jgi:hypothetical protein